MSPTRSVSIGPVTLGGKHFVVIAGPCSIESEQQFLETATTVKAAGATLLRGGIYKLRTDPNTFQGLGDDGLRIARMVRKTVGLPIVTEVTDARQIPLLVDAIDVFQVGSRNMYNYELLKELAHTGKPVLLKRAFSATIEEWLLAAEYLEKGGNPNVILCERGIRTFEPALRNTLDLAAVPYVRTLSQLPIIVDPSHGTGRRDLILPMSLAAAAAGADGLLIEVHPHPEQSLSDGYQSIDGPMFATLMTQLEKILAAVDRPLLKNV
ncbi:MAG: 3-deoxy-7-phosphoheptulonate synthase [Deltaproteobacteria bacterium]|nr:3-deoxy-7-phosphoheptulonate synthase [Deltaproteobacteria bacterium]